MTATRLVILGLILSLAGCSKEPGVISQPDMLIPSGHIKMDSGRTVQVVGYDSCANPKDHKVVGSLKARGGCTVVPATSKDFEITVGTGSGMVVERWAISATTKALKFIRPNGDAATIFRAVP